MLSKRILILFLTMILVTVATSIGLPARALHFLQNNGNMDFDGYCRSLGYSGARIDPTQYNVNSWGCVKPDDTQVGMDLYDLCKWQYGGSLPNPKYSEYNDPYSWFCSASDESSSNHPPQSQSESHDDYPGADGNCGNALYPGVDENGNPCRVIDGKYLLSEPDINSPVIGLLPPESHLLLGLEVCNQGYRWYKVQTSIGNGWESESGNTSCILPEQNTSPPQPPQVQPTLPSNEQSVQPGAPEPSTENWSTSISQCGVNPLLYEFYKDEENILKLVLANPSGFLGLIQNVLAHIGFWIDLGKIKFEPMADEVYVTLRYSNLGDYEAQVDRYLQGNLLSSDIYPLDEATYLDYQNKLGACGIIT